MTTDNKKYIELIDVNNNTIESSFIKIRQFAHAKGFSIKGDLKLPTNMIGVSKGLRFDTKKAKKTLRNYINRIHRHVNMQISNKFLHFLFRKIYKLDDSPSVEYSEKEIKIQAARKAWKKAAGEAEKLRIAYRAEKGDFYKKASEKNMAE